MPELRGRSERVEPRLDRRGWFARAAAASLGLGAVLLLSACGEHDLGGIPLPSLGMPEAAAPSGLEKGLAGRLEKGDAGTVVKYHHPEGGGPEVELVLGPKYESARGLECRTGHVGGAAAAGSPTSYAFCRIDGKWHAMRPVVISGY